jgi:hypothetical protein
MRIHRVVAQLGIAVVLAGTAGAQSYAPPAEFKCMQKVSKLGAKFMASKTKCVTKCFQTAWKGLYPATECAQPYGLYTAACIANAEGKFSAGIRAACAPTYKPGTACPECYSGGWCGPGGESDVRVESFENQLDAFFPALFCETTPTPFLLQMRCMATAAKGVVKHFTKVTKCYDKCYSLVQKGLVAPLACAPPASEPLVAECLADARADGIKYIDHDCHPEPAQPDGCGSPYPTAEEWIDLADAMTLGDVPLTYCASPSGAFVE